MAVAHGKFVVEVDRFHTVVARSISMMTPSEGRLPLGRVSDTSASSLRWASSIALSRCPIGVRGRAKIPPTRKHRSGCTIALPVESPMPIRSARRGAPADA